MYGLMPGVIGGLVAILLYAIASKHAARRGVEGQLRHCVFMKALGVVFALPVVVLLVLLVLADHPARLAPLALTVAPLGVVAALMMTEAFRTVGSFDRRGIELMTAWTGRKSQKWSSLRNVKFNGPMSWYELHFADGTKIRISSLLQGHGRVLQVVRALGYEVI